MATKKTHEADLERRRWEGFLLGLIVVLATGFVALEYNASPSLDTDEALLEALAQDLEMLPAMEQERMLAEVPVAEEPVLTPEVNIVEEKTDELDILDELLEGGDEALNDNADDEIEEPKIRVEDENKNVVDMRVVEQLPEFPGGMSYFIKWLTKNIVYPNALRDQKRGGLMVASFIINQDGSVSNIEIVKSFDRRCDDIVMNVLRKMPQWTPGIDHGQPCRTMMVIPFQFNPQG